MIDLGPVDPFTDLVIEIDIDASCPSTSSTSVSQGVSGVPDQYGDYADRRERFTAYRRARYHRQVASLVLPVLTSQLLSQFMQDRFTRQSKRTSLGTPRKKLGSAENTRPRAALSGETGRRFGRPVSIRRLGFD